MQLVSEAAPQRSAARARAGISTRGETTAEGIRLVLVCGSRECRHRILTMHCSGTAVVSMVSPCPKCGRRSEFAWTPDGVDVSLLPEKRAANGRL